MEILPQAYTPALNFFDTEKGIKLVKDTFEHKLAEHLNLQRVSAPRFLVTGTGLQDDLAGTQVPVSFTSVFSDQKIEMVHSLAKWKRYALGKYGFKHGTGLYTDMDAIRKDENVDAIHSIYVDQWDWERIMSRDQRNLEFLKYIVDEIYRALLESEAVVAEAFPVLTPTLPDSITYVHTEELAEKFPGLTPQERETAAAGEHGAIFLVGIGNPLKNGAPHDLRAADYDDWSTVNEAGRPGLNGDIIVWDSVRNKALELSSMGIRVDGEALLKQLEMMGLTERQDLPFHKEVLENRLPLSVGGGIGQSRLCMKLLQKAHVGEVQSSVWPQQVEEVFKKRSIILL